MPGLEDIPAELLRHVLSFFVLPASPQWEIWNEFRTGQLKADPNEEDEDDYESLDSLYSMCLVSKKFRDIAQPLLLANFTDDGALGSIEETVRFANCLSGNSDLGQFVQDITIGSPIMFDPEISDGDFEVSEEQIQLLTTAIKALGLGAEEDKWISAVKNCDKYRDIPVYAALILNKTPNLRHLVMPGTLSSVNPFPELFRRNPSFLRRLEKFGMEGQRPAEGYDYASYADFFALPSLKIVMFENGDLQSRTCPSTWEPRTFNIEELIFRDSMIDAVSLGRLTGACKNLKVFLLNNFDAHTEPIDHPNGASLFNAADAHKALLPHKDTLEHLRIEFPRGVRDLMDWQRFLSSRAKIGSLREFSVLSDIHLQQAIVPVHPQFPPTLKRLFITDCNSSVINLVKNIAKDCRKGLYPDLVEFRMLSVDITQPVQLPGQRIPENKTPEQAHQSLVDLFKDTKVEFCIAPFNQPSMDEMLMDAYGGDYDDDEDWDDDGEFDENILYDHDPASGLEIEDPIRDALRDSMRAARLGGAGRGGGGAGGGGGIGGPNGPMPPGLLEYFMQRAMQDPDFAHLHRPSGGNR
ncbi:hypothetical protein N7533_004991 [Penicillium manginii]|uniref:uncharacterized protein n=1 Tax=Penicillium manginii TaxID=203109 RepID=UPI002547C1B8|nr:uncharacterized protein N7533_004991 [Penicillium manginii]KAJ5755448.1 hypothetical protein N7533_004991 [Penicillium manginii]